MLVLRVEYRRRVKETDTDGSGRSAIFGERVLGGALYLVTGCWEVRYIC